MKRLLAIVCGLIGVATAVGAGVVAGMLGWSHLPEPTLGVVAGIVVGITTFAILRMLWSHRVTRVLVILALAGHIGFWSYRGMQATGARAPHVVHEGQPSAWPQAGTFRAGYGRAAFTLPTDAPLGGWGSAPRRHAMPAFAGQGLIGRWSLDVMAAPDADGQPRRPLLAPVGAQPIDHPVGASAIVIAPDISALPHAGTGPVAFVSLDTVTVDQELASAIQLRVAGLGFMPSSVLVSATHTHSGPGGYSHQPLSQVLGTGHFHQGAFDAIRDAAVAAIQQAYEHARPARLAFVRARDRGPVLALNRRRDDQAIDDRVLGLRFESNDGQPIAWMVNYAVHPVVFRRRYPATERDLVGALERELATRLGAPVVYFNGALGDISPQPTPGLHRAERCQALAKRFADVVASDLQGGTAHASIRMASLVDRIDLGAPLGIRAAGDRAALVASARTPMWSEGVLASVTDAITLPANAFVWSLGLTDIRVLARWGHGVGVAANMRVGVPTTEFDVGVITITAGDERMAVLWQPGEATQAVGRAWRAAAAEAGYPDAMLLALTNGACAYLTSPEEYARGGYEAEATLFGEQAAQLIGASFTNALTKLAR